MKEEEPISRLIFRWHLPEGAFWRLMFWAIVATIVLTAWMLLFQVVFPRASRRSHATQHITLLDTASPETRQMVAEVADRSFLLLSPGATGAPRLSELRPVFSPGFKDYELQVKDLPETGGAVSMLPRLFSARRALLPPLPAPAAAVTSVASAGPAPVKTQRLVAVASDGLEGRAIVHNMAQLAEGSPALGEIHGQIRVAVSPDGRLLTAVSLMDESSIVSAAVSREFRQAIEALRFAPVTETRPQWGTLAFRWQEAPPP